MIADESPSWPSGVNAGVNAGCLSSLPQSPPLLTYTHMRSIRFGNKSVALPASRLARMGIGAGLVIGGFLGFLPILGFWMIPLGLVVLSIDVPIVRRWRRQASVWIGPRLRLRFPWLADKLGFANACPNGLARPYRTRGSPKMPG